MASKLSPDARQVVSRYFEHLIFLVMIGMTKARDVEKEHGKLGVKVKALTEDRMESVARDAGAFFAKRANPSPKRLTPEEINDLKIKAIEYALEKMENDAKSVQQKKR
jgi:uncharacterized protein YcbX